MKYIYIGEKGSDVLVQDSINGFSIETCEGARYNVKSLSDLRVKLRELREKDFNVPEQVFYRIDYEEKLR